MTANDSPVAGLHLVRYGIPADHKFLLGEFLKTYDQLVINAAVVAHMPAAVASFITHKAHHKPYLIDPQTHAFQHDVAYIEATSEKRKGEIRRSIRALIDAYGEPIKTQVAKKHNSVLPRDFKANGVRVDFCERVLRFQAESVNKEIKQSDASKYYEFLEKKGKVSSGKYSPTLLVAPYFLLTGKTFDFWLDINVACFEDSIKHAQNLGLPIAVQVVLSRDVLLGERLRKKLVQRYTSTPKPALFMVWIDAFPEQDASKEELEALVQLFNDLGNDAPVVNLYGGFFSVALARCNIVKKLVGVTHGLEYAEDRPVVPVGGGIPTAKYYFPALHSRLPFRLALRAIKTLGGFKSKKDFHEKICDCKECRDVIRSDPETDFAKYGISRSVTFLRKGQVAVREFPLPETRERSVRHYMWRKEIEYRSPLPVNSLISDLRKTGTVLGRAIGLEHTAHCQVWADVLAQKNS